MFNNRASLFAFFMLMTCKKIQGLTKSCTTLFWGKAEILPDSQLNATSVINSDELVQEEQVDDDVIVLVRKNYVQSLSTKWVLEGKNGDGNISASTESSVDLLPNNLSSYWSWTVISPIDVGGTLQVDIKLNKVRL